MNRHLASSVRLGVESRQIIFIKASFPEDNKLKCHMTSIPPYSAVVFEVFNEEARVEKEYLVIIY